MSYFFVMFFTIYGLLNLYLFWKVYAAMPGLGKWHILLGIFLVFMVLAPIIARRLDTNGHWLAWPVTLISYTWLAAVFWFLLVGLGIDIWNLVFKGASLFAPGAVKMIVGPRVLLASALLSVGVLTTWGVIEAQAVKAQHITISVPHLPPGSSSVTIAQLTDLHLGVYTGGKRLEKVLAILRKHRPDMIVATGDMIDSPLERIRPYAEMLTQAQAPLGKFAVLGNHEFYVGIEPSEAFHEAAGFQLLRGGKVQPAPGLVVAGVDDRTADRIGAVGYTDETAVLSPRPENSTVILLKHQPVVNESALGLFDLQISGHTHGGQVFPFHIMSRMVYPRYRGLYRLDGGAWLHVSTGAGTWGPPMRVLARPEVLIITLQVDDEKAVQ